ncbi:MAG: hypothetical protein ACLTX6_00615 [Lachnospiraceae bacterium]
MELRDVAKKAGVVHFNGVQCPEQIKICSPDLVMRVEKAVEELSYGG